MPDANAASDLLLLVAGLAVALGAALLQVRVARRARARSAREFEALRARYARLAASEERYRGLVEAQTEAVVQYDAAGRIVFADEGFAALVGATPLALLGRTVRPDVAEAGAARTGPDGIRFVEERVVGSPGAAPRWFAWTEIPVGPGGDVLRAGRDVTEQVAAARGLEEARARAEAASEAKSRFLATVSHEFRTPLNGILGMARLLKDTPPLLTPEQRTYLGAVETSGEALLSLIDEILDFSKIEAGRLELAAEPFDLPALVEGVVELLGPRAQDKGIEVAAYLAPGLPRRRIGDADRLRQVLVNLAGNAVKFTETGGVGVRVEPSTRPGAGPGAVIVRVEDTGPGISAERLPLLFQEFEQGDDSASRRHEGTGLGLAITRRIVERMGGTVGATSTPGVGSIFEVELTLPAVEEGADGRADAASAAPARGPVLPGRVLLVSASPFGAPFLARRLDAEGVAVELVATVEEGLAVLARHAGPDAAPSGRFGALLADRALGDAAVRALAAAAREAGVGRRLVLLSPFDRREFGSPHAAGFDGYLVKPVRARSLLERLAIGRVGRHGAAGSDAEDGPGADRARIAGAGAIPATGRPRTRVLLAEDNAINALLARTALARLGAEVEWARDGLAAVAAVAAVLERGAAPFDLALLDVRMPGLDGLGAARQVRALERAHEAPRLRLVALTANALPEDERAARAAGFDDFLAKPLDLDRLPALLEPSAGAGERAAAA